MNRPQVEESIRFLDSEIPRDNARVKLAQYGGGPDEGQVIANEAGYLRLGVEFLKAAFAAPSASLGSNSVEVDIEYLITQDSSINFDWFERRDVPSVATRATGSRLVPNLIGCTLIATAIAIGLFAFVGLVTAVSWLFSL